MTDPPVAQVAGSRRRSLTWLLPLGAAILVVAVIVFQVRRETGPRIIVRFSDAANLEPDADIVYRGLRVGIVRDVRLLDDLSGVEVVAELAPHAAGIAREGASFWIVQPEVSLQRVAGLETLLGPRYIAVRPGPPDASRQRVFDGLDAAPIAAAAPADALLLRLRAMRAGDIAINAPVLYRDVRVGSVVGLSLAEDATTVLIELAIQPRYAPLVRDNSRFWYAGGVGVDWGLFSGLSVEAASIGSLLEGAIAFATPRRPGDFVPSGQQFELESRPPDGWQKWDPQIKWNRAGPD